MVAAGFAKLPVMAPSRGSARGAFVLPAVVFATCIAAALAHVVIDMLGDVVLAHDTYDGLVHGARGDAFGLALALALAGALRTLWVALGEAHARRTGARDRLAAALRSARFRFPAVVVALTMPALAVMEALDLYAAGGRVAEVGDLFGGSLWLAGAVAFVVGTVVALCVRDVALRLCASRRTLVATLGALLLRAARPERAWRWQRRRSRASLISKPVLSRSAGKRAPPLFAS